MKKIIQSIFLCVCSLSLVLGFTSCNLIKQNHYPTYENSDYNLYFSATCPIALTSIGCYPFSFFKTANHYVYDISVEKGSIENNTSYTKVIQCSDGSGFSWIPGEEKGKYDFSILEDYIKIVVSENQNILGFIVLKLCRVNQLEQLSYSAQCIKSISFPKINGENQKILSDDINRLYEKFKQEGENLAQHSFDITLKYSNTTEVLSLPSSSIPLEVVKFHVKYNEGESFQLYINGKNTLYYLYDNSLIEEIEGVLYYTYYFRMPYEDVTISLRKVREQDERKIMTMKYIENEILPYDIQDSIIQQFLYSRLDDFQYDFTTTAYIYHYYGTYNQAVVFDYYYPPYAKELTNYIENIDNQELHYLSYYGIYVYYNNYFYTLTKAYQLQLLSKEQVLNIIENTNHKFNSN